VRVLIATMAVFGVIYSVTPAQAAIRNRPAAAIAATAQRSNSSVFQYTIVSAQPQTDSAAGAAEADTAFQAGFNTLRLIMPWTYPAQAEVVNDKDRLCSVAAEAAKLHMRLFLNLVPANATPPVTSAQIRTYVTTLGAYMSHLIGPKGCAQGLSELGIEVANEPNYSAFWPQATAAEDYTHLLIRVWRAVHKEAAVKQYSVPVTVIGGELASSHDPAGFMADMETEALKWRMHGPFFDLFAYHCYGTGSLAVTPPDVVRTALTANFGQTVPLLCSEYALPNATAQQYCQAEFMAVNTGLAGFGWFRLMDDPTGSPTGLYYNDRKLGMTGDSPVVKISLASVPSYNTAALNGNLTCA
jgi:hypothetical protein